MANALSLFMPVLPGTTLGALAQLLVEAQPEINKALESIGTVHFARFLLLDRSQPNLLPNMADAENPSDTLVIAVITEYDGSFDDYINDFVAQLGGVFDALLAYVIGGAAVSPVNKNVQAFLKFIKANDGAQNLPNNKPPYEAYDYTVQYIKAVA